MNSCNQPLAVDIAGIKMKTPVMTASGTFGFGLEYADLLDLNQIGAIVVKGMTLKPRDGNTGRRIVETPAGMLNAIGLENPGIDRFLQEILPQLAQYQVPVIVNISGGTIEEYGELARRLANSGIAGLEVNISCPNVKQGGMIFGTDPDSAAAVVSEVKKYATVPVIAKLSPNVTDIVAMAQAVESAGADAISLINTLLGMAIDVHSWRPVLGNIVGGLSGPAVKPIAVRMVWQVAKAVKVPVIGMGGIMTAEDAVEFLLAGASAVAVGTANFINPRVAIAITEGIADYLRQCGLRHVNQLVGQVRI
ncbi:dihydroorotate dehydrogenase family protein [Thermosinus carboxydivorans Nor1]|uniref:Dihydroorotate dehydrogenase n=1 Tax=Thermosinus carboxydivorans Nor1 TaxID=401526 RepID=A1HPN3_9FIRM|nr:dihydroorotate dehydrogenase [Thermosinus carboxydivorans]EAX48003.1 dihydroorotate dehydrogenase family protein [Thermosinus carboxydivorans Nor1]